MKPFFVLLFSFLCALSMYAQEYSQSKLDALEYEELLTLFSKVERDSIKAEKVARTYLNRARRDNDTIKMARGYDRLARIFHSAKNIAFADSIIKLTESSDNITYPALGYIIKGLEFDRLNNLEEATKYYLSAYKFAIDQGNISQQIFISNMLIFYKSVWGNKDEALELQKKRHALVSSKVYLKKLKNETRKNADLNIIALFTQSQVLSLQNYSFCYLNIKKIDSARFYANRSIEVLKNYSLNDKTILENWSHEILMEIDFYDTKYRVSINRADSLLYRNDFYKTAPFSLINSYLFKGLSYEKLGDNELGLHYLKLADSVYENNTRLRIQPYQRVLFEKLLEYYKSVGDTQKSIGYLNKLIVLDSIFKRNYQFFEPEMIKKFETPKLLAEKENLISQLE